MHRNNANQRHAKVDDATKMAFSDEFFHFIVDKSLIDCIYWVKDEGVLIDQVIQQTLSEYHRYDKTHIVLYK